MPKTSSPSLRRNAPTALIENRRGIAGDDVELSLYDVRQSVDQISLRSPHLFYYGMVQGKKLVHIDGEDPFVLYPGESLVVPPFQTIEVEFPDVRSTPVKWVNVKVNQNRIRGILENISEVSIEASASRRWRMEEQKYCRLESREGIHRVLEMITYLIRENPPNRDRLVDLNARELMIHLLQTRSRPLLVGEFSRHTSTGGLAAAVQYIQNNLDRHISIDELVEEACMSKSSFYRHFSEEFDMSPLEYITRERVVRARELLEDAENTVTNVSHALGFSSTSHFIDMFKEHEGITPKQYQLEVTQ
jgi:AraC-like DNA-binding protein